MQTLYIVQTPNSLTQCQYIVKFQDFDVNTTSSVDTVLTFFVVVTL